MLLKRNTSQHALTVDFPAVIWTVIPPNNTDEKLEHGPMWYPLKAFLPSTNNCPPLSLW